MAVTRRAKSADQADGDKAAKKSKKKQSKSSPSNVQFSLLCIIVCGVLITFILMSYTDLYHEAVDQVATKLGYRQPVYAVVIDAGSTGSRVNAYTFRKALTDGRLILEKSLFEQIEPGLSSFANEPEKGAESIKNLIERAKREIPDEHWENTPLTLKATAGLRLLKQHKADNLLNLVKEMFSKVPFQVHDVSIMDGNDEGIFSWITVNFLFKSLTGQSSDKSAVALDLGGGSIQATFAPTNLKDLKDEDILPDPIKGLNIPLWTHSYLGLGLMAARRNILLNGQSPKDTVIRSDCLPLGTSNYSWNYASRDYHLFANDAPQLTPNQVDVDKCYTLIVKYVREQTANDRPPVEMARKPIVAFSYFYDRACDAGLIDRKTGGSVKVRDINDAARKVCAKSNQTSPLLCLDLLYISSLLQDGLGFEPNTQIRLLKKIDGHEISWALGLAFNMLQIAR